MFDFHFGINSAVEKWILVTFGKSAGKTMSLPQIVFMDPDWFWYMGDKKAFTGALAEEANDIAVKSSKKSAFPAKARNADALA